MAFFCPSKMLAAFLPQGLCMCPLLCWATLLCSLLSGSCLWLSQMSPSSEGFPCMTQLSQCLLSLSCHLLVFFLALITSHIILFIYLLIYLFCVHLLALDSEIHEDSVLVFSSLCPQNQYPTGTVSGMYYLFSTDCTGCSPKCFYMN